MNVRLRRGRFTVLGFDLRLLLFAAAAAVLAVGAARAQPFVSGLEGSSGSAIGPDGALYVTEGAAGRISRIDLETGEVTPYASGLPVAIIGIGGPIDITFVGGTAYVLVTLVAADVGGGSTVGIYRVDGPNEFTVVADIGTFAMNNPPTGDFEFFVPTGVQYALEPWRGGFLVTDGHHNRVLYVTLDGDISDFRIFDNTVPTGLAVGGNTIYMAEAGPIPHLPEDGRVLSFESGAEEPQVVAAGARLPVDVELGRGPILYALAQGEWDGEAAGDPALPNTGSLVGVKPDGTFTVIAENLDRPTSFQVIGTTAYVVTLTGDVLKIDDIDLPLTEPDETQGTPDTSDTTDTPTDNPAPIQSKGGGGGFGAAELVLLVLGGGVRTLSRHWTKTSRLRREPARGTGTSTVN